MTSFKSDFLNVLSERGFIHQCTDAEALDTLASAGPITGYIGYDATASSLHAGHLVQIMLLYWLQKTGNKPIVLMGGGTTKVGDPTFKDTQRPLLTDEQIQSNMNGIKSVFNSFLTFGDGATDAIMVNNDDWLSGFGYIEFLRTFGTHFTINRMLTFDSVKLRLEREQPMTFLEFNYMLMQAVDFRELNSTYNCVLQMGGSDQWGNIVNGVELTRRLNQKAAFGLTTPLLTTASGAKMGKTVGGAVWLNADALSPYDYWQYWRNTEDADVGKFMRLFTDLPMDEIRRLEALQGAEINEAKKILADAATRMVHGEAAAATARDTAQKAFEQGTRLVSNVVEMDWQQGQEFTYRTPEALAAKAFNLSIKDAKRSIANNEIKINGEHPATDKLYKRSEVNAEDAAFVLQRGKKTVLVKPV
ncbi:tyrosine--tRNA ligase [Asticcacaulis excentricus]|nr:tyrosine--tRNA ligase [Asticcacaulis excentricus]